MQERYIGINKNDKPNINLTVRRVEPSAWKSLGFHKHHYLTAELNPACKCFLFEWNGEPIAFGAVINSPRKGLPHDMSWSRMVILPDYQGLGLSTKIASFLGGIVKSLGDDYRFTAKFAHTKLGEALSHSPKWKGTAYDGKGRSKYSTECEGSKYIRRLMRVSYCKEYIGDKIEGYEDIMLPISEMRKLRKKASTK